MRQVVMFLTLLLALALMLSVATAGAATLNTVNCANKATSDGTCTGTNGADKLLDEANAFTDILGRGGNDVYIEYSGDTDSADTLHDSSTTSSDTYKIANRYFVKTYNDALWIIDAGGSNDVLNLYPTGYDSNDCWPYRITWNDLFIDCPGRDNIIVFDYYTTNSIERFRFADGTFTLPKGSSAGTPSQAQEQTSEPSRDEKHSSEAVGQQAKANASPESWKQEGQPGETT